MNIIVTGSNGLIGKNLAFSLMKDHVVYGVDNGADIEISELNSFIKYNNSQIDFIFHLGANTNAKEKNQFILDQYNLGYSQSLWYNCMKYEIPIIYASSSAVYGADSNQDDYKLPISLKPLSLYGRSKNDFDKFVLGHSEPPGIPWVGLRLFNVYGHNEGHKRDMASFVYQVYSSILKNGYFDYYDLPRFRDMIYVEDVVEILKSIMLSMFSKNGCGSGLYNLGTGYSYDLHSVADLVCEAMGVSIDCIKLLPPPEGMFTDYQFFTQAKMEKLSQYIDLSKITPIKEGITKYINILNNEN